MTRRARMASAGILAMLTSLVASAQSSWRDADGEPIDLSRFRGSWLIVNYWATWCTPCLKEIPELVRLHQANNVIVLGVNTEALDAEELRQEARRLGIGYPVVRGAVEDGGVLGEVPGLPTSYIVSPEGNVVARNVGEITAEAVLGFIAKQGPSAEREGPGHEK